MATFSPKFYDEIAAYMKESIGVFHPRFAMEMGKPDLGYAYEACKIGAIARLLGVAPADREYFWYASIFFWPFDGLDAPVAWTADMRAYLMSHAAICAHLAGRDQRAAALREWALQQYEIVPSSLYQPWQPGGASENDNYGKFMLFWAYTAALLGRWHDVESHCAEAVISYERSAQRRAIVSKEFLALARALGALARCHHDPSPNRRREAEQALGRVVKAGKGPVINAKACIYLWDLQDALPGLIGAIVPAPSQG